MGLEGGRDEEALGDKGFVEQVAALVDVKIAEGNEVLVVGIDVAGPVFDPAGDTVEFGDTVFGSLTVLDVEGDEDKRLVFERKLTA